MFLFPLAAAAVSATFAFVTWRRADGHALRIWAFSLVQFSVAAFALWWGAAFGWNSGLYKLFYVFGAMVNVAWLGLGTIHVFSERFAAWFATCVVVVASAYAAIRVGNASLVPGAHIALRAQALPAPKLVMPGGIRALSRWFSIGGSVVVLGGLMWSIVRRRNPLAFALLAIGVVVVGVAGELARAGHVLWFSAGLAVGVSLMFAGFLRTSR